jgi:hypothetical protein
MNKILYLLGAGASALAIPPVNGMKVEIENLKNKLIGCFEENLNPEVFKNLPFAFLESYDRLKPVVDDLDWLLIESRHHATVDTLARKYYLFNDLNSLKRLKKSLIVYFTIKQLCLLPRVPGMTLHGPDYPLIDPRYDGFIAAITEKQGGRLGLKGNIKVLTWNYDIQLELSLKRYVNRKVHEIKEDFQIFPNHNSFSLENGSLINMDRFAVLKLNGNAFWDNPSITGESLRTTLFDQYFDDEDSIKVLGKLLDQVNWLQANNNRLLDEAIKYFNFAWETDKEFSDKYIGHENNLTEALRIARQAEILVVIGYSFPVFNRDIDSNLLNEMIHLKKIYIQDFHPEKIKSLMENAFKIFQIHVTSQNPKKEFQLEDSTDQFIIPYEL